MALFKCYFDYDDDRGYSTGEVFPEQGKILFRWWDPDPDDDGLRVAGVFESSFGAVPVKVGMDFKIWNDSGWKYEFEVIGLVKLQ